MILQFLTIYGITYLLAESNLLAKQREWIAKKNYYLAELVYCTICLSFWVALFYTGSIIYSLAAMGVVAILKEIISCRKNVV